MSAADSTGLKFVLGLALVPSRFEGRAVEVPVSCPDSLSRSLAFSSLNFSFSFRSLSFSFWSLSFSSENLERVTSMVSILLFLRSRAAWAATLFFIFLLLTLSSIDMLLRFARTRFFLEDSMTTSSPSLLDKESEQMDSQDKEVLEEVSPSIRMGISR